VSILDADKEGFLRSYRSLIQTFGRAARNEQGRVILYADKITDSMRTAMGETERRREKQDEFNREHGITPRSVRKSFTNVLEAIYSSTREKEKTLLAAEEKAAYGRDAKSLAKGIKELEREMRAAAKELEFEKAALLRDKIAVLREELTQLG
jgi:excinuclease ABC subunit B